MRKGPDGPLNGRVRVIREHAWQRIYWLENQDILDNEPPRFRVGKVACEVKRADQRADD